MIPFFASPLRVGFCPRCGGDLRIGISKPLAEHERQIAHAIYKDLEFLLSPQPWEMSASSITGLIGREFTTLRQRKNLTQRQLSAQTEILQYSIKMMENEPAMSANVSFQVYLVCASFLGTTLQNIFNKIVQQDSERRKNIGSGEEISSEEAMINKVGKILEKLICSGERITQNRVCQLASISMEDLHRFPEVKKYIEHKVTDHLLNKKLAHKAEIRERIEKAVETLKSIGRKVTNPAICELVGISLPTLKRYKKDMEAFEPITVRAKRQRMDQAHYIASEDELLAKLEELIRGVEKRQETITRQDIIEFLGLSKTTLRRYPRVRLLLKHLSSLPLYIDQRRQQTQLRQEKLLSKAEGAIRRLEELGQPITQRNIASFVGLSPAGLHRYPKVLTFINTVVAERKSQRDTQQFQQREEEIISKVMIAMQESERLGLSISGRRLARRVGISAAGLKYYPRVRSLLETTLKEQGQAKTHSQLEAVREVRQRVSPCR